MKKSDNPTNEDIKNAILFLKGKETIRITELAEFFQNKYNFASKIMDILENNGIVSEFKGKCGRDIICDKSIFDCNFIFININDFL